MKSQFIKIITKHGKTIWLNPSNIVAVYGAYKDDDCFVILTNATSGDGEGQGYTVEGSLEVFLETLDAEVKYFA